MILSPPSNLILIDAGSRLSHFFNIDTYTSRQISLTALLSLLVCACRQRMIQRRLFLLLLLQFFYPFSHLNHIKAESKQRHADDYITLAIILSDQIFFLLLFLTVAHLSGVWGAMLD